MGSCVYNHLQTAISTVSLLCDWWPLKYCFSSPNYPEVHSFNSTMQPHTEHVAVISLAASRPSTLLFRPTKSHLFKQIFLPSYIIITFVFKYFSLFTNRASLSYPKMLSHLCRTRLKLILSSSIILWSFGKWVCNTNSQHLHNAVQKKTCLLSSQLHVYWEHGHSLHICYTSFVNKYVNRYNHTPPQTLCGQCTVHTTICFTVTHYSVPNSYTYCCQITNKQN